VLCAGNNMQAVNCTTPAQYFHLLRRQMYGGTDRRGMRKPLVVFTPKSLLRHPKAVSTVAELTSGGFREVLPDSIAIDPEQVTRVVFCSGKIYYDLLAARESRQANHVALVRIEQLYPFAESDANDVLMRYPLSTEVVWAQEEPRNMGPWRFMQEQIQPLLAPTSRVLRYVGRAESASPATGSGRRHQEEQAAITDEAMSERPLIESRRVRLVGGTGFSR
jgi:2-oxoglutarate dehydrogenase E1 component